MSYTKNSIGIPTIKKTADATLDYSTDWTKWLATVDDTIASHGVSVGPGITLESDSRNGAVVTAWIAGGVVGKTYSVVFEIATTGGRTERRTINITVVDAR